MCYINPTIIISFFYPYSHSNKKTNTTPNEIKEQNKRTSNVKITINKKAYSSSHIHLNNGKYFNKKLK